MSKTATTMRDGGRDNGDKWDKLSEAWVRHFLPPSSPRGEGPPSSSESSIRGAIRRTLALLHPAGCDSPPSSSSVPFVCRYRSDAIFPLSTTQVHLLDGYARKHASLSSLRRRVLDALTSSSSPSNATRSATISRIETTVSRTELKDMHAPFKTPPKGSLEDRIRRERPWLVDAIDGLWNRLIATGIDCDDPTRCLLRPKKSVDDAPSPSSGGEDEDWSPGGVDRPDAPFDGAVVLLANRIAADVRVTDALSEHCARRCRVRVRLLAGAGGGDGKGGAKNGGKGTSSSSSSSSFEKYRDFDCPVRSLRDHQVLAMRRGVDRGILRCAFDVGDDDERDKIIRRAVFPSGRGGGGRHRLYREARADAWTRLLKKRCTARVWKDASRRAEEVRGTRRPVRFSCPCAFAH